MKKLRWQLVIIFATGIVLAVLLLTQQSGVQPLGPQPVEGGSYTEALVGSYQRFNPLLDAFNSADRDVDRLLFSGLIKFDARGLPTADLAEAWGVSLDGTIYNFTLKPDLKWSDGEPLTTRDVLFTIELMRNGGDIIPADLQEFWKSVEVLDFTDTQMQFKLPEPFAPFLDYLTFGILPEHILSGYDILGVVNHPFNYEPVGSGPYRLEQMIVENGAVTGAVLVPNEYYYGQKPFIQQFIFRYYPDSSAALQAYREGIVQGISRITPDVINEALKEPTLNLYSGRLPQMTIVFLNLKNPEVAFFQDAVVRIALMNGINRQKIINTVFNGQAILANGPIFPENWAYYEGTPAWEYDLEKAKFDLREGGYVLSGDETSPRKKNNVELKFTLLYPDDETHRLIAESLKADWAALNIFVTLQAVPYDQLIGDYLNKREYQAALVDLNLSRSPDPDPYPFWDQVQATGGQNYSQWDNRMASEYLEGARLTASFEERVRLYRNFQVIFNKELPSLPLFYPVYTYAVDQKVQGISFGPLFDTADRFSTVTGWYLQAQRTNQATP